MPNVRRFEDTDASSVVEIHRKVFARTPEQGTRDLESRFREVFLHREWTDDRVPSLVFIAENGSVAGFLGVTVRRFLFQSEPQLVAVSQHLMIDPEKRLPMAAMELLRQFLSGPQDLSVADMATDLSRKMWHRLGGRTSFAHSIHWRRPLQPSRAGLKYLGSRGLPPLVQLGALPLGAVADAVTTRVALSPFRIVRPEGSLELLDAAGLLHHITAFSSSLLLHPEYTLESLDQLLQILSTQGRFGSLEAHLVKDGKESPVGWFVYHCLRGGTSEVLQVCAKEENAAFVLDHLIYHAHGRGSYELTGRLDPLFMRTFSSRSCFFVPGRMWMLTHSRHPEILSCIDRGDAFFTRLEGDLWLV